VVIQPSILCPTDYSEASVGALRYALALGEHFATRVIVLSVEDPLLTKAQEVHAGVKWTPAVSAQEVASFVAKAVGNEMPALARCEYEAAVGKPAAEILRIARERSCDLVVMSSHGRSGVRKLFFGSTTERVLRETSSPVLVTPPTDPGPLRLEDAPRLVARLVAPVDLSPSSSYQADVAGSLAAALEIPLLLVHVLEPVEARGFTRSYVTTIEAERRSAAEAALGRIVTRHQGLHASPWLGPRMGSVTYRTLCLSTALVLALPPKHVSSREERVAYADDGAESSRLRSRRTA